MAQDVVRAFQSEFVPPSSDYVIEGSISRIADQVRLGNKRGKLFEPTDAKIEQPFRDIAVLGRDLVAEQINLTAIGDAVPCLSSEAGGQLTSPTFRHIAGTNDQAVNRHC